jgi:hypothetical protein
MPTRSRLVLTAALAGTTSFAPLARAQDSAPSGEPLTSVDPTTLTYDYLVDGDLAGDDPANNKFATLQAAYDAAPEGTPDHPTVIGIVPNVYLLPGGMSGPSLNITKSYITLLGLTNNRRSVVLADNRGNAQGATDNGYVIVVNATGFTAKNLTILNYCNVDYEYPGDPTKNLSMRSNVITQAVALQASGDKHVYENVALLSRLDTMFLMTTRSYFKSVFIEGTDDFIGGGAVSAWEDSEIFFPTGSGVMSAANVAFINSTFSASSMLEFSKTGSVGVALINSVLPGASVPVAWVRGAAAPRPNQYYVTYQVKDAAGNPAMITDSSTGAATFDYSWELTADQAMAFNPWNLLRAPPTGDADDWDPAGAAATYDSAGAGSLVYRITLSGTPASIRTAAPGATIGATVAPTRADQTISWSTPSSSVVLSSTTGSSVVVTGNETGAPEYVPIIATASNGFHATAWVYVEPAYLDPPVLTSGPTLSPPQSGMIAVDYAYDLADHVDQSVITWSICADASCSDPRDVAVSRDNVPLKSYTLTPGDVGNFIRVSVQPKHNVSDPGPAVFAVSDRAITACDLASTTVSPNFTNFVTTPSSTYVSGLWTVLGTWTVQAGSALVNGHGIRAGSQGAALLYQDDAKHGDMQVVATMTPEKTSGAGFGSPGSGADGSGVQKSDIYIKYDPRTQTGYSLRFWRTTQSAQMVMFQLYQINNGMGTPLNDTQVLTGVFKPNTQVTIKVTGTDLTVQAQNSANSQTLSLEGTITPNDFGGAGVAWYGTVSPGNSNVYSQIEISYPGAASPCPTTPVKMAKSSSSGCGCATGGGLRSDWLPPTVVILVGALAAYRRRQRRRRVDE